jgi:2-dehydropantoate 2-reductase
MKIAVMGAGAVGAYYGGMLARAGHAVSLIGRATHVDAIRRDGLHLEALSFDAHVPLAASTDSSAVQDADIVLFCVKSTDTETAATAMAQHLRRDALVLSLQNGVDNVERLRALLQQQVIATAVYVATEMAGAGHVRHHGRGELVLERSAASDAIAEMFAQAGVPAQVSDNVDGALWTKLILNCAYNALSAITRLPYGPLVRSEGALDLMRTVVDEALAVARAAGVQPEGDVWEAVLQIARTMPTQTSSTAQDLARGRRTEIDHLNGYVVRRGEALGVATPANRVLHTIVTILEGRGDGDQPQPAV